MLYMYILLLVIINLLLLPSVIAGPHKNLPDPNRQCIPSAYAVRWIGSECSS